MRVDKWLWAVRLFKTRSQATDACAGGHVQVNGRNAKPATTVKPGDVVAALVHGRPRVLEVVELLDKRVAAPRAADAVVDRSPPPPPREKRTDPLFRRETGAGRPTKRERRALDRFRSR